MIFEVEDATKLVINSRSSSKMSEDNQDIVLKSQTGREKNPRLNTKPQIQRNT